MTRVRPPRLPTLKKCEPLSFCGDVFALFGDEGTMPNLSRLSHWDAFTLSSKLKSEDSKDESDVNSVNVKWLEHKREVKKKTRSGEKKMRKVLKTTQRRGKSPQFSCHPTTARSTNVWRKALRSVADI
ncbi:hypothetical protein BGW80DRAFT_234543 [Lactifluus volemus]|nr:hypothetical protein BGW80DRAFT_234543 [Lactifluus volemus]